MYTWGQGADMPPLVADVAATSLEVTDLLKPINQALLASAQPKHRLILHTRSKHAPRWLFKRAKNFITPCLQAHVAKYRTQRRVQAVNFMWIPAFIACKW
jgi:hypothetical protein